MMNAELIRLWDRFQLRGKTDGWPTLSAMAGGDPDLHAQQRFAATAGALCVEILGQLPAEERLRIVRDVAMRIAGQMDAGGREIEIPGNRDRRCPLCSGVVDVHGQTVEQQSFI